MVCAEAVSATIERVVETYSDMLLRVALHHTANISDAEDAVQTVFLKLVRLAPAFADERHEKAWLLRVTINQCRDFTRSAWNRITVALPENEPASGHPGEAGPACEVLDAVRALPPKYRDAVYLFYYEGYTTAEIGGILGLPRGTVESRLHRARARLKELLGGAWE